MGKFNQTISGALEMNTVAQWTHALKRQLQAGADITVDLSGVSLADSAALALLLEWQRQALRAQVQLTLVHMPSRLQHLAQLYGVDHLLMPKSAAVSYHEQH